MTNIAYPVFWAVVDANQMTESYPTIQSLLRNASSYTDGAIVLEIDPAEYRTADATKDLAAMWMEKMTLDDALPAMFEKYIGDEWAEALAGRDDPFGLQNSADRYHDERVGE